MAPLAKARVATSIAFLLFGTALGAWTARIPAIKRTLDLSDGQLSIALLAFAAGAISGMQLAGRLVDRRGSASVLVPAAVAEGFGLVSTAYAPSLLLLSLSLFTFGGIHGALNIAMNANGVEVQRAWERPILTSFHAIYSLGGFLGAAIGGMFALFGLGPRETFAAVGAFVAVLALWSWAWLLRQQPLAASQAAATAAPQRMEGLSFLGVLAFCCLVGEGAAADWSTVYLRDHLGSSAGFAAAAYAAFSLAMVAGRVTGDALAARFGAAALVRASALLAGGGLAFALAIPHPITGVAGFGCLGAGLACIAPQVFSVAGNRYPARAGQALARVAGMGYAGFLIGPVLIGGVAELSSLRWALLVPVALAAFVAVSAAALRPGR